MDGRDGRRRSARWAPHEVIAGVMHDVIAGDIIACIIAGQRPVNNDGWPWEEVRPEVVWPEKWVRAEGKKRLAGVPGGRMGGGRRRDDRRRGGHDVGWSAVGLTLGKVAGCLESPRR